MAQKITPNAAMGEAERLLEIALTVLHDAGNVVAAAHVAHALSILRPNDAQHLHNEDEVPVEIQDFKPSWGLLVERRA